MLSKEVREEPSTLIKPLSTRMLQHDGDMAAMRATALSAACCSARHGLSFTSRIRSLSSLQHRSIHQQVSTLSADDPVNVWKFRPPLPTQPQSTLLRPRIDMESACRQVCQQLRHQLADAIVPMPGNCQTQVQPCRARWRNALSAIVNRQSINDMLSVTPGPQIKLLESWKECQIGSTLR